MFTTGELTAESALLRAPGRTDGAKALALDTSARAVRHFIIIFRSCAQARRVPSTASKGAGMHGRAAAGAGGSS